MPRNPEERVTPIADSTVSRFPLRRAAHAPTARCFALINR